MLESEGVFDNGQGELSDAAAALDWIERQNFDYSQCWVSGFFFWVTHLYAIDYEKT